MHPAALMRISDFEIYIVYLGAFNKFLDAYIPIHGLHSAGKMPDEAYKYTIKSLLETIKK